MPSGGGGGGGGDRLEVDPDVLIRAGQRLAAIGSQLGQISDAAAPILNAGIASGWDMAGLNFGLQYSDAARQLAPGLATAANGCKALGLMLEASGHNYANADAQSTIGGSGPAGGVSGQPSETKSASVPSGPNGMCVLPPPMWVVVCPFLGGPTAWPMGHPPMMGLLAAQWENIAKGLAAFDDDIAAIKTVTSTQHVPEGGRIQEQLTNLASGLKSLAQSTAGLADEIKKFADEVHRTQVAIKRLLERLSPEGILDTITGLFTGKGAKILREVVHDIGQVLANLQDQVRGAIGLLGQLADAIGDAVTELQKLVRPVLVATFGDDVGNVLASAFDFYTDFEVGVVTGLLNTVSGTLALLDVDTWKGMYQTAVSVAEDPSKLDDVLLNMGKGFIAYDKITGDHPGRGLGEAGFNIAMLFTPGGAASKTGTIAKGLRYGSKLLDEGRLPRLGDLPGFKDKMPSLGGVPGAGNKLPDVPEFKPGAIPDSVMKGPAAPDGINAAPTPRELGGPARPPDPPGPHTTPADGGSGGGSGGGPPPEPPGRSVGPPDAGPGRVDGPTQPSPPSGTGHPPNVSEPPTSSHSPSTDNSPSPVTPHAPESPTPTGTSDPSNLPSEPSSSQNGHGASTPEGSPSGQHGGAPGLGQQVEHPSVPSEQGAVGHEGETHAPTDHEPAHTPVNEQHDAHERPATDGGQVREQPFASTDEQQHSQSGGTPSPVLGGGMPMNGSHGPGVSSTPPGSAHTPNAKMPSPETVSRTTDSRTHSPAGSEVSRAPAHNATGPVPGNSPAAPVNHGSAGETPSAASRPTSNLHETERSDRTRAAASSDRMTESGNYGAHPLPEPVHNPPHTGLHDPPANSGVAGDRLPDLGDINREFRQRDGEVDPSRFNEWTQTDAVDHFGDSETSSRESPHAAEHAQTPDYDVPSDSASTDQGAGVDASNSSDVPISEEKFNEILSTEKGLRPPPESYLPPEYIADHLKNFENGASRILIRSDFEEYGVGKPDVGKSEFVLTKDDADAIIAESGGDPIRLAEKLGIPADQLRNDSLVIIDFNPTAAYTPHMPSGNEWGANNQWLPGGRLPKGDLEAIVLTDGMINGRDYTARDIGTGEVL